MFPRLFFPASDPAAATLASLATFGIAFFARPIGSALFGHFGDRIGRKTTLIVALSTMGLSTVVIGALPTYADASASRRRCCWRCAVSDKGLGWAANGEALFFLPSRMRRPGNGPGTACSRNWVHLSDSFFLAGSFCYCPAGSPTSNSSRSAGACRFCRALFWYFLACTCD